MKELLEKYKFDEVKHASTPMVLNIKLNIDQSGKLLSEKVYRGMIGSLMYLPPSRADIMFTVCLCSQFQSAPKESLLKNFQKDI